MKRLLDQNVADNLVRFDPTDRGGHNESFFLKATDPDAPRAFWLRFTILSPKGAPEKATASSWAIWFDGTRGERIAVKQTVPAKECKLAREGRFHLRVGRAMIEDDQTDGVVEGPEHTLGWDLDFTVDKETLHLLPSDGMLEGRFPRTKTVTPHPDSRIWGRFRIDDRVLDIEDWKAMQGHNWGRDHAETYSWTHCNAFEGAKDTCFEGLSGKVKAGFIPLPLMSLFLLRWEGEEWAFNGYRDLLAAEVDFGTNRYTFEAARGNKRIVGEVTAEKERMVGLEYEGPTGRTPHCLNSMIADMTLELHRDGKKIKTLKSEGGAALEILTRDTDHGVDMLL